MMTPYDIHVGEWVYGHHLEGSDDAANGTDGYYPVCIDKIDNDSIETTDGEVYDFNQLSPIPLNVKTAEKFCWPKDFSFAVCKDPQSQEIFFHYLKNIRRIREKRGLASVHEAQQWYYDTFNKPMRLTLAVNGS